MIPTILPSSHPHLKSLSFPVEEYRERVRKVQRAMAPLDLDALLCHTASNICYLTGFEAVLWFKYTLAVVPREGDPILLAEDFEMPNACATVWLKDLVAYPCGGDPIPATQKLLQELGLAQKRLGIEVNRWSFSVPTYQRLKDALSAATLVDANHVLENVKAIKSPAEIAVMRCSAQLTSEGMKAALSRVKKGATDNHVAAAAYKALLEGGSEYMSLDPIVTVGARSSIPHSTYRRAPICAGDSVLLEMGACIHRYSTASMRTAAIKPVPDLVRQMSDGCIASLKTVIENMKPGAVGDEIAKKADAAWSEISTRLVWHGYYAYSLGLGFPPDWNDCPAIIRRESDLVLKPGMIFHVTTSLREVGVCGTACSETVLVTEKGPEVLTQIPRELRMTG